MRPGEQQPGDQPYAQWANPYQQPGYQQPNPYQTEPQQPAGAWTQPAADTASAPTAPGTWQQPGPAMPPPPGGRPPAGGRRSRTAIAVVAATAVVATAVIAGVVVLGGDDESGQQANGADSGGGGSAGEREGEPAEEPTGEEGGEEDPDAGGSGPDDPRRGILQVPDPVVAEDWQVQTIENRHNAFDVPPDTWQIGSETEMVGFVDEAAAEEDPDAFFPPALVTMSAPALYMDGWCPEAEYGSSWHAAAGTKGGQGATGTAEAAVNEAGSWAIAGYDQDREGTLEVSEAEPFESDHGIVGHTATATITDVPEDPENECGSFDGKVVTVSYIDLNNDLATWVLITDTGFPEELDEETIEQMMNSLRPYPAEAATEDG